MYLDLKMFRYLLWKNNKSKKGIVKNTRVLRISFLLIIIIYFNQYTPINVYLKKDFFVLKTSILFLITVLLIALLY